MNSGGIGPGYAYGAWQFVTPPGSHFSDVSFTFNLAVGSGHWPSVTITNASGGLLGVWNTSVFAPNVDHGADTDPMQNGHALTAWLECGGNCPPVPGVHTYFHGFSFTIEDDTPPELTALGGDLLAGGVRRGVETIEFSGSDAQGGIAGATIRVNGVVVADPRSACPGWSGTGPARSFRPCPAGEDFSIQANTEIGPWANGENSVEVCVQDLAFVAATALRDCETRTVSVDNSCPSSGGTEATSLDAGLQTGNGPVRSAIRVPSSRPATVRGTVAGPGSVAGSTVCLYEQVDLPGDGRELVDTARVRSDGRFALAVDPGPSRLFDVVYRYNDRVAEKKRLYLDSVVVPTFKIVGQRKLRNGQNVRFRGRLPGPNADGRGISLQARAGRKWRTFKQVRATSDGTFRGIYRFTQTVGLAEYTFRARVKKQGNYPYSPGHSRRRVVTVQG